MFPELGDVFAPGAKVVHIDLNAYEIAKNHPVDLGVVADPKLTLAALADALERTMPSKQKDAATARASSRRRRKAESGAAGGRDRGPQAVRDAVPLHLSRFMEELAPQLPADVVVFDEALTNSPAGHALPAADPDRRSTS